MRTPGTYHVNAIVGGKIVGGATTGCAECYHVNSANHTVAIAYTPDDARAIAALPQLIEAARDLCTFIEGLHDDGVITAPPKAYGRAVSALRLAGEEV